MIWNSVFLMTIIDVAIVAATGYCGWALARNVGCIRGLGFLGSVVLIFLGLLTVAVFYLLDLFTMHVAPPLVSAEWAFALMSELHMNWSWGASLLSVGVLVLGFGRLLRNLVPETVEALQRLEVSRQELEKTVEKKEILEAKLRASQETLEQRVEERTNELRVINRSLEGQILERRAAEEKIRHLAYHDVLTNLVNRNEFERRLARVIVAAREQHTQHALLYLDLDQFKVVNDTCGHAAGDELLRQVSRVLKGPVRQRDTVARLGGDEFGLLLENCPANQAREVAERVRALLVGYRFQWQGATFIAGASIGIAFIDKGSESMGELFRKADLACFTAKELGRNRVHEYCEQDAELSRRHGEMQWVSRLNAAVDNDSFQLLRQTIVSLDGGEDDRLRYELLIRMRDQNDEFIAPGAFIPAAERFNMIGPIDRWVIREAFRHLSQQCWNARKTAAVPPFLFINLSGMSLNDSALPDFIAEQLELNGIDGSNICFEVTETAAVSNLDVAANRITSIKALGCRFALDDFGSGLSSFSYFQALPVDYIKIDGNIVKCVLEDPMSCAIVESVQHVARAAGIETIAEHVENDALLAKLRAIGIDYAQGYGIDRPQPLDIAPRTAREDMRLSV